MKDTVGEGHTWDWLEDADDVVVRSQPAVAVYPGPAGVVIRRQGDWNDDDDVIWFGINQAPAIAKAIMAAAGLDIADLAPEPAQVAFKPMGSTAAARQKRYRERKKKEPAREPDIFDHDDRNGVTPEDRNGVKA